MSEITHNEPAPTLDEVWRLFRENSLQMREERQETNRRFQETERLMREGHEETERQIQATAAQIRENNQKVKELDQLFNTQWGRLMESLVEGALIGIFNTWGLPVADTTTRLRGSYQGNPYEFDIVAHNGDSVVIIEVKITLRTKDVKKFTQKLGQIKTWIPRYANNRIHGAMAFLQTNAGADLMVINQGMFAIRATGYSAHIVNSQEFKPRTW